MKTAKNRYKQLITERVQETKTRRKEIHAKVLTKEKINTYEDVLGIFYGLSEESRYRIVYRRILELARDGISPKAIMELLQHKKVKK
jgi:hypothetical protein